MGEAEKIKRKQKTNTNNKKPAPVGAKMRQRGLVFVTEFLAPKHEIRGC